MSMKLSLGFGENISEDGIDQWLNMNEDDQGYHILIEKEKVEILQRMT